ncbi:MAG: COX15/CtaA family protein [Gammaproteobacteria bacterium]|nr:COX15/CtaA family protein [Gammaproteobacteria bacterium]
MKYLFRALAHIVPALALIVIVKGAYVRLNDAGLGCPDWPGCYGHLTVPTTPQNIAEAQRLSARPLEPRKAWREMIHRYLASSLGGLIVLMALLAWSNRRVSGQPLALPLCLLPLVLFQGLLGMWTVTLLLKPLVVVGHLVGGITIAALAWWNLLDVRAGPRQPEMALRRYASLALLVVTIQICLGGWTSANYAALACTDFPTCHGSWWPAMDFKKGFVLWRGLGINYEFGVLDTPARTAVHFAHRGWAVVVTASLVTLIVYTWRTADRRGRRIAWCILALLALQLILGITNVVRGLPLPVAVMHNGTAAALVLSLVTLIHYASPARRQYETLT